MRDAKDGLLLRTMGADHLGGVNVYDLLIVGHSVICGNSKNEIYQFDYTVS